MSNGPPTTKTVRKTGATVMEKCDVHIPDVCIAAEKGPVQVFHVVEEKKQLHVCLKCFERLDLSGQWVEQA